MSELESSFGKTGYPKSQARRIVFTGCNVLGLIDAYAKVPTRTGRRNDSSSHLFAFFGTGEARFSATLTMISTMFLALFATGSAYLGANTANFSGIFTATGHVSCRHPADLSAVHVKLDTAGHHFDVIFL